MQHAGKPFTNANFSDPNATRIANVGNASAVSIPAEFYDFANQRAIAPQYDTDWQDELFRNAPLNSGSRLKRSCGSTRRKKGFQRVLPFSAATMLPMNCLCSHLTSGKYPEDMMFPS